MALQDFFVGIRAGQSLLGRPRGSSDSSAFPTRHAAGVIERADLWLAPRTVARYDPKDFLFLDEEERLQLDEAVGRFREIASAVPADGPATEAQVKQARAHLETILRILTPNRFVDSRQLVAAKVLERFRKSPHCPDFVQRLVYKFDEDSSGESVIWIWLILEDEVTKSPEFFVKAEPVRRELENWLDDHDVKLMPLISFRSDSGQRQWEGQVRS